MKAQSPWTPRLTAATGESVYERLARAVAEDIDSGKLPAGARLPAHRHVAKQLGIAVGTVTRAYAELERNGLVHGERGRGTFVTGTARTSAAGTARNSARSTARNVATGITTTSDRMSIIDFSINVPPAQIGAALLSEALTRIAQTFRPDALARYTTPGGDPAHRAAIAHWLNRQSVPTSGNDLMITHGAQHAIMVAFTTLIAHAPGSVVLTEPCTFPGALAAARQIGMNLVAVAMDEFGMNPAALEATLKAALETAPKAAHKAARHNHSSTHRAIVYLTPTLHNPTGTTMTARRRQEIVAVCQAYDALIVEDDVYSIFRPSKLTTLYELAPERTVYINGLSKSLSPGLRVGAIITPPAYRDTARTVLQTTTQPVSPLLTELACRWLSDGTAGHIATALKAESQERRALAASILGPHVRHMPTGGFHVWLPMPRARAHEIELYAAKRGVLLTPPGQLLTDAEAVAAGVRICIGGPDAASMERGLQIIRQGLDESPQPPVPA